MARGGRPPSGAHDRPGMGQCEADGAPTVPRRRVQARVDRGPQPSRDRVGVPRNPGYLPDLIRRHRRGSTRIGSPAPIEVPDRPAAPGSPAAMPRGCSNSGWSGTSIDSAPIRDGPPSWAESPSSQAAATQDTATGSGAASPWSSRSAKARKTRDRGCRRRRGRREGRSLRRSSHRARRLVGRQRANVGVVDEATSLQRAIQPSRAAIRSAARWARAMMVICGFTPGGLGTTEPSTM